jgi:hypothetical protein
MLSASENTKQRYAAWLGRAETGEISLDPRVFAVDDLLPVGVVDGGNGQQEVLFYSEAAARTFSDAASERLKLGGSTITDVAFNRRIVMRSRIAMLTESEIP